ncbi:MAG TPA: MFS transporter [Gemmatimonadaceae bacterium]
MNPEFDVATAFDSPFVRLALVVIGLGLVYVLLRELRKVPAKLLVLMATAFMDMVGLLIVVPLLPFYVKNLAGEGATILGLHLEIGLLSGIVVSSFTVAQLVSAPYWGRFSDRFGRRPALMVALGTQTVAYLILGFANSLFLLFLSRLVQGSGGGTVGVIQAYVADTTAPEERARSLGWLSAATNLGVALGPLLGIAAFELGDKDLGPGAMTLRMGHAAPGILAAVLCAITLLFCWKYVKESREHHEQAREPRHAREALRHVITHASEPSSRLIWIYAITMGAFQGTFPVLPLFLNAEFGVTERTIGYFYTYIGAISVFTRALVLGHAVDRLGEARLSRVGLVLLAVGLAGMPLSKNFAMLALAVAMIPLGTAFTFPCVTALLSRVIHSSERGLYMGLQQTFGGIARVIGPLSAGLVFDHLGVGVPFLIAGVIVVATISLGLGLDQYAKRPTPATTPS